MGKKSIKGLVTGFFDGGAMSKYLPEKNFFEQLPVGFYRSTPDGRILYANPALAALLDFDNVDDLMDMSVEDLFAVKHDRERQFEQLKQQGMLAGSEIK